MASVRAAVLVAIVALLATTAPTPARTADAPIAPSVFVAVDGDDTGSCGADAPCATLDRAVAAAAPGATVEMAAGEYPQQEVAAPDRPPGARVLVRPAPGARVHLAYLRMHAPDVEVRGLATAGWYVDDGAHRVTLRNIVARGAPSFITGADDVRILGGAIRDVDSADGLQVKAGSESPVRGLVIDGLHIAGITRESDPSSHSECVQFTSGRGIVIRNSRFEDCSTQGVFLKEALGGVIEDVLIENNWFGQLEGFSTLILDDGVADVTVRYNSFAQPPRLGGADEQGRIRVVANVGALSSCAPGVEYAHNVWSEVACGPTDTVADPGFVDPEGFDLRLRPESAAIGHGDSAVHPETDITGAPRAADGAPPAAGATELEPEAGGLGELARLLDRFLRGPGSAPAPLLSA